LLPLHFVYNKINIFTCSPNVGLEINAEKTKNMIMSHHRTSGRSQNIRTANETFENVAKFKYLGMTPTNQNDMHDKVKSRLNSGNACYHSVQNLSSSRLIQKKNYTLKNIKNVILSDVLYGCETWSLTSREEHRLGISEKRVLRETFGPNREEN
jgi:hypothetical protein